jgi:DNA-binding transcriptional regulator YbjK
LSRTARGELRRRAILKATLRLVARDGPHAATHRAVAAEAGVPLAATTYYFASRDDLVAQALRLAVDEEMGELQARLADLGRPQTAREAAEVLATLFEETLAGDHLALLAKNELYQAAARTPALQSEARRWTDAYLDLLAPILEHLGAADPRGDALIVVAALDGLLDLRVSEDRCGPDELRARLQRLLGALCATPAGA